MQPSLTRDGDGKRAKEKGNGTGAVAPRLRVGF
jgi:hypothetical protein